MAKIEKGKKYHNKNIVMRGGCEDLGQKDYYIEFGEYNSFFPKLFAH